MTYDPGADVFARYPDVIVRHRRLGGVPAATNGRVVLIETTMSKADRRCALAHEIAHLDLGHTCTLREGREERDADKLASSRLIPLDLLADTLRWALSPDEVADTLDVTTQMVRRRIRALTVEEKSWITSEIARKEESA